MRIKFALTLISSLHLILGAGNVYIPAYRQADDQPINVGREKQLFIDDWFTAQALGVHLTVNQPKKTYEKNLISDRPYEDLLISGFTIIEDDGVYKAWYSAWSKSAPDDLTTRLCYAVSKDGVHFEKPVLRRYKFGDSMENNIVFSDPVNGYHAGTVFKDPEAAVEERYKLVYLGKDGVRGATSRDGISWKILQEPILEYPSDTQNNCFWDPSRKAYVLFHRLNLLRKRPYKSDDDIYIRMIGRAESKDFNHFPSYNVVMSPDELDGPRRTLYTNSAIKYPFAANAYLIFTAIYDQTGIGSHEIQLATSRDGIKWTRPSRKYFLPKGMEGSFDSQKVFAGVGLARVGDELSLYYTGFTEGHKGSNEIYDHSGVISRVTMRPDGFVSYDAGTSDGTLITRFIKHSGSSLGLNVKTHNMGLVKVELLGADLEPIKGFTAAECDPISGDFLNKNVTWEGRQDVSATAGKVMAMRFLMRDAKLFAFHYK